MKVADYGVIPPSEAAPRGRHHRADQVRLGAIRISESLANDVITGWVERRR